MPTVAIEGRYRFVVNTRENAFEPPHVHVWIGNESACRIELLNGAFMDDPPPGTLRDIRAVYERHAARIFETWDVIHGGGT